MTVRQARDEGARQTAIIAAAVKRHRLGKGWSAAHLADEMAKVGVPWNQSAAENLEYGRRKSLRVHELVALVYVLDVPSLLDLLVPDDQQDPLYPVTPSIPVVRNIARAWVLGETGPLRDYLSGPQPDDPSPEDMAKAFAGLPASLRRQIICLLRSW
jgi:hypothetical protein